MKKISLIPAMAMAVALSACGGSGGGGQTGMPPPATDPATPGLPVLDAFFAAVQALIGDSSDSAEPVAVDSVTVTMPENGEPTTLK
ncbi:hypothetical protein ACFOLJ_14995 [Rugamonas sp. CCM 8940]|uniref:hypothetical protein n=1 Tax=Rugamonas sp. CCM 8940 TaxID=2765359 RepID=UPI0018F491AE|nr:hypothetical protein [Rugamonas sp. CCM 8940]MBJ7313531.1 hypothetical protein [Rugamonas sp. CCM 8940]